MKCLKCGEENRNDTGKCFNCNTPLLWTPDSEFDQPVTIKVSRLALVASILALCGLILCVIGIIIIRLLRLGPSDPPVSLVFFLSFLLIIAALILGLISMIRIEISGGKKTGRNFAVGAILISLFSSILLVGVPFLARTRCVAFRMVCGTNLSGIGKAMLIYANDYDDEFPRAGGKSTIWGQSVNYNAMIRQQAYGMKSDGSGGAATISASLYLLVKYAEVPPKSFICHTRPDTGSGDKGVSEFKPLGNVDLLALWDFGSEPWLHNSYAYHMPYGKFPLTTSSDPGMAVAADRNPWIPSPGWPSKNFNSFNPNGNANYGNTPCHQNEGQNVLFLDTHVNFESVPFCGVNQDNIYTSWNGSDISKGTQPVLGSAPAGATDSLLVNDPPIQKP